MEATQQSLERPSDIGLTPSAEVRRWILELQLAKKREKDWVEDSRKIWDKYRQKDAKKNSFNILWSNTETLRPAVYNSAPKPDVRRRFKDADPVGKSVSEVLSRSIEYAIDVYDFDYNIKQDVLDMLLPGRGLSRVRYVPSLAQVGTPQGHDEEAEDKAHESEEGDTEELVWEQVVCEHVQWDDFRTGPGKCWDEVTWIAFRHRLKRDELVEKFGEVGELIPLDNADDEEIVKENDANVKELFKTAEVWEIWNKDTRKVLFVAPGYKDKPAQVLDDPLELVGFWPIPRPLYAIEDSSSTVPVPLYKLYAEQGEELDRISTRINKLVAGLKMRGIYDATLSELSELMRGEDNDLIPAANVSAFVDRGGLDNAIWFMPIEQAANVLKELYVQREAVKNVIYEITGIADIVRGASNASETATAQQIKDKWGSMRLKKMQLEVQRYIRDLIRLMAEIIAEKFQPETLLQMTGLELPTQQEVQQQQMMLMLQAQQSGQQPPQQEPQVTIEQVMAVLRDDAARNYKIDVETDSTVAASQQEDMQGLQQVATAIGEVMKEVMPLVQAQVMPLEVAKELLLNISRRSKFGTAFEDAIDKMVQPPPPPQEQQPQDNSLQVEQMRQQGEQAKAQQSAQLEQMKMQADGEREAQKVQVQAQLEQFKAQQQAEIESQRLDFERFKAQLDAETKVLVAQISADAGAKQAQISAETTMATAAMQGEKESAAEEKSKGEESDTGSALAVAIEGFKVALENMSKPRKIVRDGSGRVAGVE